MATERNPDILREAGKGSTILTLRYTDQQRYRMNDYERKSQPGRHTVKEGGVNGTARPGIGMQLLCGKGRY